MAITLQSDITLIEFNAILDNSKNLICRELSIYRNASIQTWFFQLPHDLTISKYDVINTNNFLQQHFHHIPLSFVGDCPYDRLQKILVDCLANCKYAFTKGEEKVNWLTKILPNLNCTIIDLNILKCQKNFKPLMSCLFHTNLPTSNCSFRNVLSNSFLLDEFVNKERRRIDFLKENCPLSSTSEIVNPEHMPFSRFEFLSRYINCQDRMCSVLNYPKDLKSFTVIDFWRKVIARED